MKLHSSISLLDNIYDELISSIETNWLFVFLFFILFIVIVLIAVFAFLFVVKS